MTNAPHERGAVTEDSQSNQGQGSPPAPPLSHISTRSAGSGRGGHAIGGHVISRYRAHRPTTCQCCRCPIAPGEPVYEVLTDDAVVEVCGLCAGAR
jgi:hypothetical protein